jgi:hypothetical protein
MLGEKLEFPLMEALAAHQHIMKMTDNWGGRWINKSTIYKLVLMGLMAPVTFCENNFVLISVSLVLCSVIFFIMAKLPMMMLR